MRPNPKLVLLICIAANSGWAQTNAWEFGHPDAKLLMGINFKGLRESAAGRSLREQMNAQRLGSSAQVEGGVQAPPQ